MTSIFAKRHYEAIAAILYRNLLTSFTQEERGVVADIRKDFADLFAGDNPRFDRARFLQACGLSE